MGSIHKLDEDVTLADAPEAPAVAQPSLAAYKEFTTWCLGLVAVGALVLMAFVIVIDPYRLFGLVDAAGFNHIKPQPEQYQEQIKVAQAVALRPDVVFVGNSRVEIGIDPESAPLRMAGYSAYNLGLSGSRFPVSQRVLAQLRAGVGAKYPPPAMVVVGVEFLDFLVDHSARPAPPAPVTTPSWQWRFDTLFSIKSVSDAIHTLRLQRTADPETMTPRGHDPLLDYNRYAREEGYYAIFQQRAEDNAKQLVSKPHDLIMASTGSSESIDRLRQLLDMMAHDGTEVHLMIYPYHAQLMAMFEETGLMPTMDAMKRLLVHEADSARKRHPGARITVWDFSGYSPIHCERIPAPGDTRTVTQWYWEAGHYKTILGDLMLQRMLGQKVSFGVRLTDDNLEDNRKRIAAERAQCAANYPAMFEGARTLIDGARKHLR